MPLRRLLLVNDQYYHVYNKTVSNLVPFSSDIVCKRMIRLFWYYRSKDATIRLSRIPLLEDSKREQYIQTVRKSQNFRIAVICFCIMPTHFHLLLKQIDYGGVADYIHRCETGISAFYNKLHNHSGVVFQSRFKAKHIDSEPYFTHLSRYIHLNPYSSRLMKSFTEIDTYKWSSLSEYITGKQRLCDTSVLLRIFGSRKNYLKFIHDRASYQRDLEKNKYEV